MFLRTPLTNTVVIPDILHLLAVYIDLNISPNFACLRYTAPTFRSIL